MFVYGCVTRARRLFRISNAIFLLTRNPLVGASNANNEDIDGLFLRDDYLQTCQSVGQSANHRRMLPIPPVCPNLRIMDVRRGHVIDHSLIVMTDEISTIKAKIILKFETDSFENVGKS